MITAATSRPASACSMRVEVVERHLDELVRPVGQEELAEPVVAGGHGEAGVAVVGLHDRDDPAAPGRVPGGLERDVDRLAAAAAVDDLGQPLGSRLDQRLGQRRAGERREVVVADVEVRHRAGDRGRDLRVAVAEVVGAAVEVDVEQPLARHVVDEVVLAPVDDQRDAALDPEVGLAGVPVLARLRRGPRPWTRTRTRRSRASSGLRPAIGLHSTRPNRSTVCTTVVTGPQWSRQRSR